MPVPFSALMCRDKQTGGIKPLWVKCGCGKWNAVQVGAVVKYLDKILSSSVEVAPRGTPKTGQSWAPGFRASSLRGGGVLVTMERLSVLCHAHVRRRTGRSKGQPTGLCA